LSPFGHAAGNFYGPETSRKHSLQGYQAREATKSILHEAQYLGENPTRDGAWLGITEKREKRSME